MTSGISWGLPDLRTGTNCRKASAARKPERTIIMGMAMMTVVMMHVTMVMAMAMAMARAMKVGDGVGAGG